MKDEKLDELLHESLKPDSVPSELNERLLVRLKRKRHTRTVIFKTTRRLSSCAAIFLCALTVLANFNTETQDIAYSIPVIGSLARSMTFRNSDKNAVSEKKDINERTQPAVQPSKDTDSHPTENNEKSAENTPQADFSEKEQHSVPGKHNFKNGNMRQPSGFQPSGQPDAATGEPNAEQAAPSRYRDAEAPSQQNSDAASSAVDEAATQAPGKTRIRERSAPPSNSNAPLSSLFSEDYDYKNSIYAIIYYQMTSDPKKGYNTAAFTEITGNEQYRITNENELVIIFPAEQITSQKSGVCEFNVGKLSEGRLWDK